MKTYHVYLDDDGMNTMVPSDFNKEELCDFFTGPRPRITHKFEAEDFFDACEKFAKLVPEEGTFYDAGDKNGN